jgi:predicted MFS family arabinose efflux permease
MIGIALIIFAATCIAARSANELLPGFADAVFGRGATAFAWLMAMIGLGAITGGLWMLQQQSLATVAARVVIFVLVMAAGLLVFAATTIYWVALPALFVAGFGMVVTGIGLQTIVQTTVEPGMRGRVMAIYGMIVRSGPAIGALAMGAASELVGLRAPVAAGAVLCVLLWAWVQWRGMSVE